MSSIIFKEKIMKNFKCNQLFIFFIFDDLSDISPLYQMVSPSLPSIQDEDTCCLPHHYGSSLFYPYIAGSSKYNKRGLNYEFN